MVYRTIPYEYSLSFHQVVQSVYGDTNNRRPLAAFVIYMAERYKQGGITGGLEVKYTLRIALLVSFSFLLYR